MARNGSGTMTPSVDFTTEASSPPIEISKLDTVLDDVAAEITNSIAADGQTNPSADLKMNGFKHTNVGAATALTHYARVSELIDQDHIYYVDSGSANTYVITPNPAIAAYEEGQRFVFRAANASSGASTLNVNGLGAFAIQTPDGSALIANSIIAGGYYEVTYDANATPDRWVLTSPSSRLPDGMLSTNVPLLNAGNTFTGNITISNSGPNLILNETDGDTGAAIQFQDIGVTRGYFGSANATNGLVTGAAQGDLVIRSEAGGVLFSGDAGATVYLGLSSAGLVTTKNASAQEVGTAGAVARAVNATGNTAASDSGRAVVFTGGSGQTFTLDGDPPANAVVILVNESGNSWTIAASGTLIFGGATGSRTLPTGCMAAAYHRQGSGTWQIAGQLT